jgi:hypothetical protein
MNEEKGKYIFANELALATDDPMQIRAELLNILLAGRDTTAGLLSNTFHVLARRPDVWAKLKSEVDQLEGKRPDYETLRNMKYLKFVLNECKWRLRFTCLGYPTDNTASPSPISISSRQRQICVQEYDNPSWWWA